MHANYLNIQSPLRERDEYPWAGIEIASLWLFLWLYLYDFKANFLPTFQGDKGDETWVRQETVAAGRFISYFWFVEAVFRGSSEFGGQKENVLFLWAPIKTL